MDKKRVPMIIAIILILVIVIAGISTGIFSFGENKKPADLYKLYSMLDENGKQIHDKSAIILQDTLLENKAIIKDGTYLALETVQKLNNRFYWDNNEELLIYTTPNDIMKVKPGAASYKISGKKEKVDYEIVKVKDNIPYINIEFVQKYTNIEYKLYSEPNRLLIKNKWDVEFEFGFANKEVNVKVTPDKKAEVLKASKVGEKYTILEKQEKWTKVITEEGFIGYVQNNKLNNFTKEIVSREFEYPEYTSIEKDYRISMAWHQVTIAAANSTLSAMTDEMKGVNTISPTWFSVIDTEGNISSLADAAYVNEAHSMGLEVWALIDDFAKDEDNNRIIREVIPYTSKRAKLINQIMTQLDTYNIDGINIDFEYINSENGENYIQFLRELSIECRKAKKVLSVDNYVASAWSIHYNRKEQGIICDYLIIMGYDEHNTSSETAGSVASLPFVRTGIEETIAEVGNSKKVINALPFYTRVWFEEADGSLRSEAVGMEVAEQSIANANAQPNWSQDHSQYYAEYNSGTALCRVWLEDEKSIIEKLNLMDEFELAGAAYWKLGFEKPAIWDVINKYFK